ncbi:MAG: sigma-70 family RNA polymerase sigma factor [Myxococcales bacterium]|nr:sigma-70 family RNA polymerase sigma factor [Myxococcales bacterium]
MSAPSEKTAPPKPPETSTVSASISTPAPGSSIPGSGLSAGLERAATMDPLDELDTGKSVPPPPPVEQAIRAALDKQDVRTALRLAAEHYRTPLVRFCLAFVSDEVTAEDVAQTALAVAAERAKDFSGQSTFRTWLFGIARHKALDAAVARQGMPLSAVSDSRWIADAIGPVTGLRQAEDLGTLRSILDTLGEETRALLEMRFEQEASYKEIAEVFEISEQAARKRMFDALEKMRKLITTARGDFFDSRR